MRMLAEFEKRGRMVWFSHLDLQRAMQRALRRSGAPIQYSQGFNPHAELAFASALPVGAQSLCEILDVKLAGEISAEEFLQRMNDTLPEGLKLYRARLVDDRFPSMTASMRRAVYKARVADADLTQAVCDFLAAPQCLVEKQSKGKTRQLDIRPMVFELKAERLGADSLLTMSVTCTNADNLRPELLLEALCPGAQAQITRVQLLAEENIPLFELPEEA